MSGLRDARFRKALDAAPDGDLRPSRAARDAILARAHGAVQRQRPVAWWQRWWGDHSASRMPWNAAFATFAIATLVTVVWHDREVPDAKLDSAQPAAVARAPVPASAPGPVTTSPPAQAAAAPAANVPATQDSARQRAKLPSTTQPRSLPAPAEPPPAAPAEMRGSTEATVGQANDSLRRGAADASSGAALRDQAQRSELAKAAPAPAPIAAAAPAARLSAQVRAFSAGAMTLRILRGGQVIEVPLEQRQRLAELLNRIAGSARGSEPLDSPVDTRLELLRDGQPAGVLELAGTQVRWRGPADAGGTSRPDPAALQALRDELAR